MADSTATTSDSSAPTDGAHPTGTGRRAAIWSVVVGTVVGLFPKVTGLLAFLSPIVRSPKVPDFYADKETDGPSEYLRICSLAALEVDKPQRFAVISDQIDGWNFTPNQPIGSVYVQKSADDTVQVFNTTCPHAGCSVSINSDSSAYLCPCHNSAFNLDGTKLISQSGRPNPSPRNLDSIEQIEIVEGDVWINFQNFYPGRHEKKAKV